MIREAIRQIILTDGPLSSAVGGNRVYPLMLPQGKRDASLVYQRVGGINDMTLDGPVAVRETRLQLDAWAVDPDTSASLINLAETRLNGFSGMVPYGDESPQLVCDVRGIFLERELDGYDSVAKLYRDGRIFRVFWYR